jgi:hypothetical protein
MINQQIANPQISTKLHRSASKQSLKYSYISKRFFICKFELLQSIYAIFVRKRSISCGLSEVYIRKSQTNLDPHIANAQSATFAEGPQILEII